MSFGGLNFNVSMSDDKRSEMRIEKVKLDELSINLYYLPSVVTIS